MCHERWLQRRRSADEESRDLWREFERTTPLADPEPEERDTDTVLADREPTEQAERR